MVKWKRRHFWSVEKCTRAILVAWAILLANSEYRVKGEPEVGDQGARHGSKKKADEDDGNATINPCKCACNQGSVFCRSIEDEKCFHICKDRCMREAQHTVDEEGECIDEQNCTCMLQMDIEEPVCAQNQVERTEKTFYNLREFHCDNVCHDNEYELLNHGKCRWDTEEITRDRHNDYDEERSEQEGFFGGGGGFNGGGFPGGGRGFPGGGFTFHF